MTKKKALDSSMLISCGKICIAYLSAIQVYELNILFLLQQ